MAGCFFCGDFENAGLYKSNSLCQMFDGESCSPCIEMKQLEAQISEAKRALHDMLEQHQELRAQRNRVHDPIIHRMPPEIASSIFQFSMPVMPAHFGHICFLKKNAVAAPLILGAVCQHWRKIVYSTPQLWTFITASIHGPDLLGRCDIAREWLGRSGQLPLAIRIYTSPKYTETVESLANFQTLIEIINQYSSRWQLLELSIPPSLFPRLHRDSQPHSILRTLGLKSHKHKAGGEFSMKNAKPESITLSHLHLKSVEIEWNNLTHANLDHLQVDECFELLRRAPRLRNCELNEITVFEEEHFLGPINTVIHHHLEVLEFCSSAASADIFFRKVALPGLKTFGWYIFQGILPAATLTSLFERSSCLLRKFFVWGTNIEEDGLITLLKAIPSLWDLDMRPVSTRNYSPDSLFELLAENSISDDSSNEEDEGCFLPELKSFKYHAPLEGKIISWDLVPEIFEPLYELDNPRRRPLRVFKIGFDQNEPINPINYIDKETIPRLLAIIEAGIELEINLNFFASWFNKCIDATSWHASAK